MKHAYLIAVLTMTFFASGCEKEGLEECKAEVAREAAKCLEEITDIYAKTICHTEKVRGVKTCESRYKDEGQQ